MSDYKHMFELKQTDWIDACKQIDALQSELAAANATIDRWEKQEIHEAMECHKAHKELAGLKDYSVKLADKLSLCQHQLAQTRALLAVQRGALEFYADGDYSTCEAIGTYSSPMDEDAGRVARDALALTGAEELSAIKSAIDAMGATVAKHPDECDHIHNLWEALAALKKYFGGGGE